MKEYYAAISPDGELLGVEDGPEDAVNVIERTIGGPIEVQYLEEEPHPNAKVTAAEMARLSELRCGIKPISRDAVLKGMLGNPEEREEAMEEARDLLLPFFAGLETKGSEVTAYNTVSGMSEAWIGQNYKTEKPSQDQGRPAEMMGLTLVPADHAYLAAGGEGPYTRLFELDEKKSSKAERAEMLKTKRDIIARWNKPGIGKPANIGPKFTFCQGSSQECRDSCLIFTGQNASTRYNTYRKVAQTYALLNQPVAFMRMLVHSIDRWIDDCTFYKRLDPTQEVHPFFRLNMLSDIPWERIAPWLFTHYAGSSGENEKLLKFYDYTKVPGRRSIPDFPFDNYDLTFSVSGTETNKEYALEEISRYKSRIAVVILGHRQEDGKWRTVLQKGEKVIEQIPIPKKFQFGPHNMIVRDGDVSDVRPYDPLGSCVVLRWKVPSGKRSGAEYKDMYKAALTLEQSKAERKKTSFVTPVYVFGQDDTRFERNPYSSDAVLISAVTPRHMSIDQQLSQAI